MNNTSSNVTFSTQQWRVIHTVARGMMDKEIALAIGVTHSTTKTYVYRLRKKLGDITQRDLPLLCERLSSCLGS